jgi:hypothetical protein
MDQVSRPLLIVLASTVILSVLWMVALRPKDPDIANTPAAPVLAIAKAKDASAASDAANAKLAAASAATESGTPAAQAATPATAAAPAKAGAPAKPAAADAKAAGQRDAAVVREIRSGKVVVMLFWNAKGADDVATRGAVRSINRHGGKVAVHVVPISRVGQYRSITEGVTINQSPTVLVIGKKGSTRAIVGLSERGELKQAVNDALAGRR